MNDDTEAKRDHWQDYSVNAAELATVMAAASSASFTRSDYDAGSDLSGNTALALIRSARRAGLVLRLTVWPDGSFESSATQPE